MRYVFALALLLGLPISAQIENKQRATLAELLRLLRPSHVPPDGRINAHDKTWEDWLRRTGELPPDFDALPSIPGLPDPLLGITTPAQWAARKPHLRDQIQHWMFGKFPPNPSNLRATVTASRREGRVTVREVLLAFGPNHRGTLRIELIIPDGKGPFPVFLTNHGHNRPWIYTAVRRGYIACVYHATDPRYGNGDDSDAWVEVYPEYDFSVLARWAWAASRAVDYLVTLPEVDKSKIGLTGHSRNGKQALLAAAFDERIAAVIPSSGNSGECDPWRYTTEPFANESIELLAGAQSHWFHPRLRFFSGREDKLPVDQNTLLALVAPRGLMLYSGYAESAGNPVGFEQAYRDALRVYRFLGREQNVWLRLRDGEHATTAGDIESFIDFFDSVFDRRPRPKVETWINGYTFDKWRSLSGESIDPRSYPVRDSKISALPTGKLRKQIEWALGEEPPGAPNMQLRANPLEVSSVEGWLAGLFRRPSADSAVRDRITKEGMAWTEVPFGDGLKADLFYPAGHKSGKLPVVIWLHPYTYQYGWSIYAPWTSTGNDARMDQRPTFPSLVKRGFAVLAFDQIGFGARVLDSKEFYERYPKWSLMGKMVSDTRAAVDSLTQLDLIDPSRIYLMGYSLGAKLGLLTTALDPRIRGLAAVAGFDPLRLDTPDRGVEGIRHYSHLHGLMPRLGFFLGAEARLPFDFDAALALAAPRPVLLIAPTLDRYARSADVKAEVNEARKRWEVLSRPDALTFETPTGFNRFRRDTQERVFTWLAAN
ncbi:MAG: alpha/beta fold hydrolase [Acidobacteriia bacterium]|nr:alpha/beta fold hydrolase [Terriglobia bacterium]